MNPAARSIADRERIAIIGAGHVGSTTACALMLRALVREIVLIDSDAALADAEAAHLSDANALARPCRAFAGTWAEAASAPLRPSLPPERPGLQRFEERPDRRILTSCAFERAHQHHEGDRRGKYPDYA